MLGNASVRCGQLLVVGIAGTTLTERERTALARGTRGGVVLFKRNIASAMSEIAALNAQIRDASPPDAPPLIAVDQEGGRVVRIGPPALALPPMRVVGDLGDVAFASRLAEAHARELRALGFTMSFAPVADVHTRPENPIIGDRAFASSPEGVARFAEAWADGLKRAGLLSCAKHFPGHGDTTVDSHLALPHVDRPKSELETIEFAPFRALARAVPAMMTAHVVYSAIDRERPATLSPAFCTELLRKQFGFGGVLFSDDLEMKALTRPAESAVLAIAAGCDVLLVCSNADLADEVHEALVREAESSPAFRARCDEALNRSLAMRKAAIPTPDAKGLDRIFAESRAVAEELAQRRKATR